MEKEKTLDVVYYFIYNNMFHYLYHIVTQIITVKQILFY